VQPQPVTLIVSFDKRYRLYFGDEVKLNCS
jgi:hypothetical protein